MKRLFTLLLTAAICCTARSSMEQTITIDSVSGTHFCTGDPISVTFTATGNWKHNNAFTLQLSDDSGHFNKEFQNLGSVIDTAPGTTTIITTVPDKYHIAYWPSVRVNIIPRGTIVYHDSIYVDTLGMIDTVSIEQVLYRNDTTYDTVTPVRYRLRVIGAYPYTVSAGDGTNISITPAAGTIKLYSRTAPAAVGIPIDLSIGIVSGNETLQDTVHYDFGDHGAEASANPLSVVYSTPGKKVITMNLIAPGGCSAVDSAYFYVHDCTQPVIPSDAIVVSKDTTLFAYDSASNQGHTFWINPGIKVTATDAWTHLGIYDTIFAESGATVNGGLGSLIYLKPGASAIGHYKNYWTDSWNDGLIIYGSGASIIETYNDRTAPSFECPDLTFDYTSAPPNSIMHINDAEVTGPAPQADVVITPNPSSGIVTIANAPATAQLTLLNVLGQTVRTEIAGVVPDITLDLSPLAPGTYYLRIASNNSVTTKKLVKE